MTIAYVAALALVLSPTLAPEEEGAAAAPAARHKVLALDLSSSGIDDNTARIFQGDIAKALTRHPSLEVTTAADLQTIADLEGQKAALGCDTDSCLAEIAGAMGARYIVYGRLGAIEDIVVVQLNLFDSEAAKVIAREDVRGQGLKAALAELTPAVHRLVASLVGEDSAALAAASEPKASTSPETAQGSSATATDDGAAAAESDDGSVLGIVLLGSGAVVGVLGVVAMAGLAGIAGLGELRLSQHSSQRTQGETELWTWAGPAAVVGAAASVLLVAAGAGLVVWGIVE